MGKSGGTKMLCPNCERIRVCKAIPMSEIRHGNARRWYSTDHPDITWFRRGRRCLTCLESFGTIEVNEKFIGELVEFKDALLELNKHSEQYIGESKHASMMLEKISRSLGALRALNIHKESQ